MNNYLNRFLLTTCFAKCPEMGFLQVFVTKIHYITYTEPACTQSGNDVKFYVREFDPKIGTGRSLQFTEPVEFIVPSFETKREEVPGRLEKLARDFPDIEFERKEFSFAKEVLWATIIDRKSPKERMKLPDYFICDKRNSFSKQLRFYYPPFTLVPTKDGKLTRPSKFEKSIVDRDIVLGDKKCALDIETMDYHDSEKERISNVVIKFKDHGYIVTTFVPPFEEFKGYKIISVRKRSDEPVDRRKSTDAIKKKVTEIIQSEDPLGIYGFNLPFDQKKLRDLGDGDYLPGVNMTGPVFKSVQGIKNMITKGRFSFDIYGYKFLYFNHYENNKLETHARMEGMNFKKSLPYEILAYKTKKAEAGSLEDMVECLTYVAEDGEVMFKIGESNEKKIISKAMFVKREPSSICTSSGRNIMKEYWEKQFFLDRNTLRNRYEMGFKKRKAAEKEDDKELLLFKMEKKKKKVEYEKEFSIWEKKNELLKPVRETGVFRDISIVYPQFLTKAFWEMIENTTGNLNLIGTPDEKLDSYQTLDEYICQAVQDMEKYHTKALGEKTPEERKKRMGQFNSIMKGEYGIWLSEARSNLEKNAGRMRELMKNSGQINYSNKFLFVKHPEEIVEENLGFVYGRGNCLSCDNRVITLVEGNRLVYQGFGISRGRRCLFDSRLLKKIFMRKLGIDELDEEEIAQYVKEEILALERGDIKKGNLLFKDIGKKKFGGIQYGFSQGKELPIEEFIRAPSIDSKMYAHNFFRSYCDVLKVAFGDNLHKIYDALGLGGLPLEIEKLDLIEEVPF